MARPERGSQKMVDWDLERDWELGWQSLFSSLAVCCSGYGDVSGCCPALVSIYVH